MVSHTTIYLSIYLSIIITTQVHGLIRETFARQRLAARTPDAHASSTMQPRAHNMLSYGGAVVALLLAFSSPAIAGEATGSPHNRVALVLWVVHFARRCAETLWLFEFGGADVPAADCVGEYAYYWGFAAAIAAALASPAAVPASPVQTAVGVAVWCAAEAANHACHRTLARRAATKGAGGRKACVPAGEPFLFSRVACPHYTFEVGSWIDR